MPQEKHSALNISNQYFSKYKMRGDGRFSQSWSHIIYIVVCVRVETLIYSSVFIFHVGKQNLVLIVYCKTLAGKNCDFVLSCYNCRVIVKRLPSYLAGANVTFVVDDLSSDTEYVFACYASSVVGDREKSNQIKVRTSE